MSQLINVLEKVFVTDAEENGFDKPAFDSLNDLLKDAGATDAQIFTLLSCEWKKFNEAQKAAVLQKLTQALKEEPELSEIAFTKENFSQVWGDLVKQFNRLDTRCGLYAALKQGKPAVPETRGAFIQECNNVGDAKTIAQALSYVPEPGTIKIYQAGVVSKKKQQLIEAVTEKINWIHQMQEIGFMEEELLAIIAAVKLEQYGYLKRLITTFRVELTDVDKQKIITDLCAKEKPALGSMFVRERSEQWEYIEDDDGEGEDVITGHVTANEYRGSRYLPRQVLLAHLFKQPFLLQALLAQDPYGDDFDINFFDEEMAYLDPDGLPAMRHAIYAARPNLANSQKDEMLLFIASLRGVSLNIHVPDGDGERPYWMCNQMFELDPMHWPVLLACDPNILLAYDWSKEDIPILRAVSAEDSGVLDAFIHADALNDRFYPSETPSFVATLFTVDSTGKYKYHSQIDRELIHQNRGFKKIYQAMSPEQKVALKKAFEEFIKTQFAQEIMAVSFLAQHGSQLMRANHAAFLRHTKVLDQTLAWLDSPTEQVEADSELMAFMPEMLGRMVPGAPMQSAEDRLQERAWSGASDELRELRMMMLGAESRLNDNEKARFKQLAYDDIDIFKFIKNKKEARLIQVSITNLIKANNFAEFRRLLDLMSESGLDCSYLARHYFLPSVCEHIKNEEDFRAWVQCLLAHGLKGGKEIEQLSELDFLPDAIACLGDDTKRLAVLGESYSCFSKKPIRLHLDRDCQYKLLQNALSTGQIEVFKALLRFGIDNVDKPKSGYRPRVAIKEPTRSDNGVCIWMRALWHKDPKFTQALVEHDKNVLFLSAPISASGRAEILSINSSLNYAFCVNQFDKLPYLLPPMSGEQKVLLIDQLFMQLGASEQLPLPQPVIAYLLYLSSLSFEQRTEHIPLFKLLMHKLGVDSRFTINQLSAEVFAGRSDYEYFVQEHDGVKYSVKVDGKLVRSAKTLGEEANQVPPLSMKIARTYADHVWRLCEKDGVLAIQRDAMLEPKSRRTSLPTELAAAGLPPGSAQEAVQASVNPAALVDNDDDSDDPSSDEDTAADTKKRSDNSVEANDDDPGSPQRRRISSLAESAEAGLSPGSAQEAVQAPAVPAAVVVDNDDDNDDPSSGEDAYTNKRSDNPVKASEDGPRLLQRRRVSSPGELAAAGLPSGSSQVDKEDKDDAPAVSDLLGVSGLFSSSISDGSSMLSNLSQSTVNESGSLMDPSLYYLLFGPDSNDMPGPGGYG